MKHRPQVSVVSRAEVERMRHTYRWRQLRLRVLAEEPTCRLRLPGCTGVSTTADHIIPGSQAPHLFYERGNVQGSCRSCNFKRGDKSMSAVQGLYSAPRALGFFDCE